MTLKIEPPLSVKKIERIERHRSRGRYHDKDGLYLRTHESGKMSWLFRFMKSGRERWMGLGHFSSAYGLSEARAEAARWRLKLKKEGLDPIETRRKEKPVEAPTPAPITVTFAQAARDYINLNSSKWKNTKSRAQWISSLETYAFPVIGQISVALIDTPDVLKCIEPHWTDKTETMSRVRGRIETVLGYASAKKLRPSGDNPARWPKHLATLLPARSQIAKVNHFSALPFTELPAFWLDLAARTGPAAQALAFAILTATRTGEVIGARWSEIDFDTKVWIIPPERMKAGKEHRVPLSPSALKILEAVQREADNPFVFCGTRYEEGLSNMAMATVLRRMKRDDITVHGFRSTFRDWAGETTSSFPNHVIEMALAHTINDKVEKAYRRGDLFAKRKALMEAWSRFVTTPVKSAQIVKFRSAP